MPCTCFNTVPWKLSKVTHDCSSDFLASAALKGFVADTDDFLELSNKGSSKSTLGAAVGSKKTGTGKGKVAKLVDVTQVRAKYIVKIQNSIQFTKTALSEAIKQFKVYAEEEGQLFESHKRCLLDCLISCRYLSLGSL